MGVFGRALAVVFMVAVCMPSGAAAAPILMGDNPGGACAEADGTSLVGSTTLSCALFALDPFNPRIVEGHLDSASDLALFEFVFTQETTLTVTTTSYVLGNFDPTLGLFRREGGILTVADPNAPDAEMFARFFDRDPFADPADLDDHFEVTLGPGEYLMALYGAELGESLLSPLFCDGGCQSFDRGGDFSFSVSTPDDGGPAPVPEPGTLTLMAGGAIAGLIQRRRKQSRTQSHSVSR